MDNILAILDSEKSYVKKLAAFLESRTQIPFHILAFDSEKKLEKFFSKNRAEVLLISEQNWSVSMAGLANQIIILTNEQAKEKLESGLGNGEFPTICKYQSGEAIAKKILGVCAMVETPILYVGQKEHPAETRAEIIGIYTPVKRSLQTSFALIYSGLRAKSRKTLYLNFEVFAGFETWFEREYKTDLMDLMYFLDGPEDKFLLKLAGMTEQFGGFYYIPPAISYEDYMVVKAEEWLRLVEMIAQKGPYEVIVLDLGDEMQGLFDMLSLCEKIYTISKLDGIAMAKIEAFEKALRMSQKEDVLHKMVKCRLPVFKEVAQRAENLTYSQLADYMKNKLGEDFK